MIIVLHTTTLFHLNESVKLLPGVNTVDDALWESLKDHAIIKAHVESGDFEVLEPDGDSKDATKLLLTMRQPEAKRLVCETIDRDLLLAWKEADHRPQVIGAIKSQLADLDAPLEYTGKNRVSSISTGKGQIEIKCD
jgi:hypothetical protein